MMKDENYFSYDYQKFSYLTRGIYLDQIKNWLEYFPREQILILQTEEFLEKTPEVYRRVLKFLNLQVIDLKQYKKLNIGNYKEMEDKTKQKLIDFFKPHNEKLYKNLKLNFKWD